MPRESLGFVRMIWYCPNCQSKNPGNFRFCRGCGAAQPPEVVFQKDDQDVLVTDAKEIEQARLGADIHCGYCGARNPANEKDCSACGADLATGTPRASGAIGGPLQTGPAATVPCPACGAPNPATALTCAGCGASLKTAPSRPAAAHGTLPKWLPFAIAGLVVLCILLVVFLTRTTDQVGTVSGVAWQRSYEIMEMRPVEHQDWKDRIPLEATPGDCEERLAGTSDQPTDRSVKVCGTPYTVDKGNGYSEVVQDCQYEVYADYCSYSVQEWVSIDSVSAAGSDLAPYWPEIRLSPGQKAGEGSEKYSITFTAGEKELNFETTDVSLYTAAQPGSRWTLKINSFGDVISIEPAR